MKTKTVKLPVVVPASRYCWLYAENDSICQYFDNEGGHNTCGLNLGAQKNTIAGIAKAHKCNALVTT